MRPADITYAEITLWDKPFPLDAYQLLHNQGASPSTTMPDTWIYNGQLKRISFTWVDKYQQYLLQMVDIE